MITTSHDYAWNVLRCIAAVAFGGVIAGCGGGGGASEDQLAAQSRSLHQASALSTPADVSHQKDQYANGGVLSASNGFYDVFVQELQGLGVGLYTIRTGASHPIPFRNLLYGGEAARPGTSFTTIRSYTSGTDYVQRNGSASSSFRVVSLDRFGVAVREGSTGITTIYTLPGPPTTPDKLEIRQTLKINGTGFVGSSVEITTSVKNLGSNAVSIGLRHLLDFQIGLDDGPTFRQVNPAGDVFTTELSYTNPSFSSYLVTDNDYADPTSPLYAEFGTVTGPGGLQPSPNAPDYLQYASWPLAFGSAFNYHTTQGLDIASNGGDTAVIYSFGSTSANALAIAPGGTRVISVSLFATPPITDVTDTDGDGLPDQWEIRGFDSNGDGIIDVDLPSMGADPRRKDIFVEVHWMEATAGHAEIKPSQEAIDMVIAAFAAQGIALHVDMGQLGGGGPIPHTDTLGCLGLLGTCFGAGAYQWDEFDRIKNSHFAPSRRQIFHYVVFADGLGDLPCTSGISRNLGFGLAGRGASDFIISLGGIRPGSNGAYCWTNGVGTVLEQAGSFMHELGHNLGLQHGGQDAVQHKPNYLSVMNYSFQTSGLFKKDSSGVLRSGIIDYSRFSSSVIPDLNESALSELSGLNATTAAAGYGSMYYFGGSGKLISNVQGALDWDRDGVILVNKTVSVDLNDSLSPGFEYARETLRNYDDWSALVYVGGSIGAEGAGVQLPAESDANELTSEQDLKIPRLVHIDVKPGSRFNPINCNNLGTVIPVAILTTQRARGDDIDFDATTVDPASVRFGPKGAGEIHGTGHIEDVDGDGDMDLVFHFRADASGILCGATEVTLSGTTLDGKQFFATDFITTVP